MSLAIALGLNKAGFVSLEQIEAAMNAHILHGGSVLLKLVELGYLSDHHLAEYLAQEFNLKLVGADDLVKVMPAALATLSQEKAQEFRVVPLRIDGNYLYLAMVDPTRQEDLEAISELTGLQIVPMVIANSKLDEAITNFYICPEDHNEDIASGLDSDWEHQVTEDMNELNVGNVGISSDDDDEDFSSPPANAEESFTYASFEFAEDEGESFSISSALLQAAQALAKAQTELLNAPAPVSSSEPAEVLTVFQKLALASSRDEIAKLTIDYSANIWPRIILLVERQNYLKVWAVGGTELAGRTDLSTMKIPLHQTSQFRKVCYQAQPYLGTLSATSRLYDSFYNRLGGPLRPQRTVMIPIYVGKRVIGLFYADSGNGAPPAGDISELYTLIDAIGSGFENLISRRHRQLNNQNI